MNGGSAALPFNNNIGESIPADTPHVSRCTLLQYVELANTNFSPGRQRLPPNMEGQCRLRRRPEMGV